jgi:hypothetical protein
MQMHPNAFSKPIDCQVGLHKGLITTIIGGVPVLYCVKCGSMMGKGFVEGTWSKDDVKFIGEHAYVKHRPRTKEQIMKEVWAKKERERNKRMQDSVSEYVKNRMSSYVERA